MVNKRVLVGCSIFCGAVILIYALSKQSCEVNSTETTHRTKCETHACVTLAAQIVGYVDESINPCDDFYKFANGHYINEMTDETDDDDSHSFYNTVTKLVNKKIGPLLSEPSKNGEWNAIGLAKSFYKSCLDQWTTENFELNETLEGLVGLPLVKPKEWSDPNFNLIYLIEDAKRLGFDTNMIFTLKVGIDHNNTTKRRLEV